MEKKKKKQNAYLVYCDGGPIHVFADLFSCYEGDLTFYDREELPHGETLRQNNAATTAIARGHWSRVELLEDEQPDA